MQTVYGLIIDGGDGSAWVRWYRKEPDIDALWEEDPETYGLNEGDVIVLHFPDNINLETAGFRFSDE